MDYLKLAEETNYNPMAFVGIGEDKNLAIFERDQFVVSLNAIGTARISHIDDIGEEPKEGAEIIKAYPDYMNILDKQEEYYIYTKNSLTLSIYRRVNTGLENWCFFEDQQIGDFIKNLGIEKLESLEQILDKLDKR